MEVSTIQNLGVAGTAVAARGGAESTRPAPAPSPEPSTPPVVTTYAKFAIDPRSNRVRVTVLDANTGAVLRKIPIVELADLTAVRPATVGRFVRSEG